MLRSPEIPALEIARADVRDGLDGGGIAAVRHPDRRLASGRIAQTNFRSAVPEKPQTRKRRSRWHQVVRALRYLLQRRHLALGDRGADLQASLEVLRALAFLLLARHLLDLDAQVTERLLKGRHLGHDLPDPAGKLRVG